MFQKVLYVIVVNSGTKDDDKLITRDSPSEVIKFIGSIPNNEKDPRAVKWVFSVNSTGEVNHYDIVFDGRLKLFAR